MANRLTFTGAVNAYTGYGLHACQIINDLAKFVPDCYISVRAVQKSEAFGAVIPAEIKQRFVNQPQPEPWELLLHPPNFMPTPGKRTAYFTMWEATKLPVGSVALLNKAEVVIVPCEWNASCFSAQGVTVPIRIVPLGINTDVFGYRPVAQKDVCVFGAAGRMAHGGVRKGINEVIDVFLATFPTETDVRLKIKCFPDCSVRHVTDPRIEITQAYLSEKEMADWYASLTCFVSAARAEGWGLMQHQSMAMGRPIISVCFGGVKEFFNPATGYPVDYNFEPAAKAYSGCGHWAEPNELHVGARMREVYNDRNEAERRGFEAAQSVAHLSWAASNWRLVNVLQEFKVI